MSKINIIAAIDKQGGLGKNNQLLCHLPKDLKYFKEKTTGHPIVMGKNTYLSIGRPLPNRRNIVISTTLNNIDGIEIYSNLQQAIVDLKEQDVYIIGGAQIYKQSMEFATDLYITEIDNYFEADVFFPDIAANKWDLVESISSKKDDANPFDLHFKHYIKKSDFF
jgi:dihydrofolate reductase